MSLCYVCLFGRVGLSVSSAFSVSPIGLALLLELLSMSLTLCVHVYSCVFIGLYIEFAILGGLWDWR